VLAEWIAQIGIVPRVESLPDEELLTVADHQLDEATQDALEDLLDRQREGELDAAGRRRLEELMRVLRVAVQRGLRPRLS
jgi:hypothetical protein